MEPRGGPGWLGGEGDLGAIRTRWESLELPSALREGSDRPSEPACTLSPGRSPLREEDPPSWSEVAAWRGRPGLSEGGLRGQ